MADKLCTVKIGGVAVSYVLPTLRVSWKSGSPSSCNFRLLLHYTDTIPAIGKSVEVFLDSGTRIYNGLVDSVSEKGIAEGSDDLFVDINSLGKDTRMFQRMTRNPSTTEMAKFQSLTGHVNRSGTSVTWVDGDPFEPWLVGKSITLGAATVTVSAVADPHHMTVSASATASNVQFDYRIYCGDVVKVLLDVYCSNEGFSYTGGSISQGVQVDKLVFSPPVTVYDAISKLLSMNSNYALSVDVDQVVYFGPSTMTSAPFNFNSTAVQKREVIITKSREDVRNVELSQVQLADIGLTSKSFVGDGTKKAWFLDSPMGKFDHAELNGATVSMAEEGSPNADYFFLLNGVSVWQDAAVPVLGSGDTLTVFYYPLGADIEEYADATNISDRQTVEGSGSGRYELFKDRTYRGQLGAQSEAQGEVGIFKNDLVKLTLRTFRNGLRPGMTVNVSITNRPDASGDFLIESVDASNAEVASSIYELEYTLSLIAAARRITPADVFRSLVNKGQNQSTGGTSSVGSVPTPPEGLTFLPAHYEYGTFTVENVAVTTPNNIRGIDFYLVTVDELTTDCYVTAPAVDTTDPKTITVVPNPGQVSTLAFEIGDWVVFNDPGHFEWCQLTNKVGNVWTLTRHYPGTPTGEATFGSLLESHAAGTKIFKGQVRRFLRDARTGGFGDGEVPTRFDFDIPAVCVGAVVAAPFNEGGYGTWVVYNCATATVPGIRTLSGGNYTFQKSGTLAAAAGAIVGMSKSVQFQETVRVLFTRCETAPTGANLIVKIRKSADGGTTWSDVETITTTATHKASYDLVGPPDDRQEPYSGSWPFPVLNPGEYLNFTIEQVGSTVAGSDITVEVYT